MAVTVSLINMKGGVGKSTLTVNLAWFLAWYPPWKKKVLVVDLDPQFNASQYLVGVTDYEAILQSKKPTIWDIFEQGTRTPAGKALIEDPHDAIYRVIEFNDGSLVDLIPSRLELALSLKNPGHKERNLSRFLDEVKEEYDVILIDCAPTESVLTTAAYLSSDWLLVPVKPEYLSTIGLPLLVNSMEDFKEEYESDDLKLAGIVFNSASDYLPEEWLAKKTVKEIAKQNGWYVFKTEINFSRSYPRGAREGRPIFRTSYSRYHNVSNFGEFATEFASRVHL